MILEFTSEAEGDLEQIAYDIAEHNPRRAHSFVRELRSRCEDLISHPNSFALVPRYQQHGIRRRVHGNHLIYYRVEPAKVVIIHIPQGATREGLLLFGE
nr:type II toxin-antitoxin system RelE/ParE family toxin [Pararhizobium arenae]